MNHCMPLLIGITGHRNAVLRDASGKADDNQIVQAIMTALKHWRAQVGEQTPHLAADRHGGRAGFTCH